MPPGGSAVAADHVAHGIMFHRFVDSPERPAGQGALTAEELEHVLDRIGIDRLLAPDDWMWRLERGALSPDDRCLTFDDGLRSQIEVAVPVLERHGLRGFFFVYSSVFEGAMVKGEAYSFVGGQTGGMERLIDDFLAACPRELSALLESEEFQAFAQRLRAIAPFYTDSDLRYRFLRNRRSTQTLFESVMDDLVAARGYRLDELAELIWMDEPDLRRLADSGHGVGLHSYGHPYDMAALSLPEQRAEYERNRDHLLRVTDAVPRAVSHPLGSYGAATLTVLAELGIICGFRSSMIGPTGTAAGPLELPRRDSSELLRT